VRAIPQLAGIARAIRASATEPPLATHHAQHLGKSPVARDPVIRTIRFASTSEGRHRRLDRQPHISVCSAACRLVTGSLLTKAAILHFQIGRFDKIESRHSSHVDAVADNPKDLRGREVLNHILEIWRVGA
jgi:hypothetical protein